MNDLLLHASVAALWTFMGGEVCDRHFPEHQSACYIVGASLVMGAGAFKEEVIDEHREKQDYIGDILGTSVGLAVRF